MDTDIFLVIGLLLLILSIPTIMSALIDRRRPRLSGLIFIGAIAMIAYAVNQSPGEYTVSTLPDVFLRVIGQYI